LKNQLNQNELLTFDHLIKNGSIEYLDVEEEENSMIAMRLNDLKPND